MADAGILASTYSLRNVSQHTTTPMFRDWQQRVSMKESMFWAKGATNELENWAFNSVFGHLMAVLRLL